MNLTEFVQKHGDPSRPNYASQHPDSLTATGNRAYVPGGERILGLVEGEGAPPADVARTVYEDKKTNKYAHQAKEAVARLTVPSTTPVERSEQNRRLRVAAGSHEMVADQFDAIIGFDTATPDQMKAKKWYEQKAEEYLSQANAGSIAEANRLAKESFK